MAELKYTYALDKNENCIGIGNAQKGIEYRCPHCKGEMVVKEGSIKVKHYAHKIRPQNCSYETYLHALAKKRIEEWFNSDSALNISFRTKDRCSNFEHCLWNHDDYTSYCEKKSSRSFNLKNYYNVITRETRRVPQNRQAMGSILKYSLTVSSYRFHWRRQVRFYVHAPWRYLTVLTAVRHIRSQGLSSRKYSVPVFFRV